MHQKKGRRHGQSEGDPQRCGSLSFGPARDAPLISPIGDDRRFIVEQTGEVRILDPEGQLLETPFLDLSDDIVDLADGFEERGLLGLAFHPDYAANGRLYVHYSAPLRASAPGDWDHTAKISEFRVSDDDANSVDPDSERILLHVDHPNPKTNGGALAFGPHDGLLYAAIGEGGGAHGIGEVVYGALEVPERGNVWDALAQGMGRDDDGELYLLTREAFAPSGDTGRLFRLTPAQDAATEDAATEDVATDGASSDESSQENQPPGERTEEPAEERAEEPMDDWADESVRAAPSR